MCDFAGCASVLIDTIVQAVKGKPQETSDQSQSSSRGNGQCSQAFWCIFYGVGIIGTLLGYGVLQERIMTMDYGGVLFSYSVFLVLCNRLAAVICAFFMAVVKREPLGNQAPLWKYLIISLSNVFASTCQYEALRYVSFAVQMLGKSFKMMPVMLWGILIMRKNYGLRDWMVALLVTGGVTEFLLTGPTHSKVDQNNSFKGFALLVVFLALDGLTSTMQEKLFKEHKVSKYNQCAYVNLLSAIVSFITLVTSGTLVPALFFASDHQQFVLDTAIFCACAVTSQFFIYSQVKEYGALVFAATMNVRQVASIIVSYIQYQNPVTGLQVVGLGIIFAALFWKSIRGLLEAPTKDEKTPLLEQAKEDQVTGNAILKAPMQKQIPV